MAAVELGRHAENMGATCQRAMGWRDSAMHGERLQRMDRSAVWQQRLEKRASLSTAAALHTAWLLPRRRIGKRRHQIAIEQAFATRKRDALKDDPKYYRRAPDKALTQGGTAFMS